MIDYSLFRHAKPAKKRRPSRAVDRAESEAVRQRAGGRCECCWKAGIQVHHLLSGHGRRGRGDSALAAHKVALCPQCHRDVHDKVLRIDGGPGRWVFTRRSHV